MLLRNYIQNMKKMYKILASIKTVKKIKITLNPTNKDQ